MKKNTILDQLWLKLPGLSKRKGSERPLGRDLSYLNDEEELTRILYHRITCFMEEKRPFLYGDFSIGELSKKMFASQARISRAIKRYSQMNFRGFVNSYRVKYASNLISKDPRMKMEEVARLSGFNTIPTFNTAFKTVMNERPSEYQAKVHRK